MVLGPVVFISHWTWTIAFYVFLFLGLIRENRGTGDSARGGGARRSSAPESVRAVSARIQMCSAVRPPRRLLQSIREAGVLGDAGRWVSDPVLLPVQNLANHLGFPVSLRESVQKQEVD